MVRETRITRMLLDSMARGRSAFARNAAARVVASVQRRQRYRNRLLSRPNPTRAAAFGRNVFPGLVGALRRARARIALRRNMQPRPAIPAPASRARLARASRRLF